MFSPSSSNAFLVLCFLCRLFTAITGAIRDDNRLGIDGITANVQLRARIESTCCVWVLWRDQQAKIDHCR